MLSEKVKCYKIGARILIAMFIKHKIHSEI